ncbi:pseudouridine synthase [Craterilacuibacter sp.]|uniref:pseudouridine synthase n=1 Tax=Craterilacuibacter sp. TaxID=2870909 RepID=UPI003F66EEE4
MRLENGDVFDHQGQPHTLASAYPANRRIWYYRDVAQETEVPFEAEVLYRDERLLVADKPHFLACIPGGRHVQQTLLTRLRSQLDLPMLTPIHRLDRETAGVMLFCIDPACRAGYQMLFQQREVQKEYEAIARFDPMLQLPLTHRSHLAEAQGSFVMQETEGVFNSETRVELLARQGEWGRYRLLPHTGRKHQLRAHLAALGVPILNDPWYPRLTDDKAADDFSAPLQLLARAISFNDPFSGNRHQFFSQRILNWPSIPPA